MSGLQFKRGTFQILKAITKVHLGAFKIDIFEGDLCEYDGQTLKFGGDEFTVPKLKAAIKAGWLVPEDDNVSQYVPASADIRIRPATNANGVRGEAMKVQQVQDEERVVGSVTKSKAQREGGKKKPEVIAVDDQGGKSVAKIKTSAKQTTRLDGKTNVNSMIRELDNKPPPKAEKISAGAFEADNLETLLGASTVDVKNLPSRQPANPQPVQKTASKSKKIIVVNTPLGQIEWDMSLHWSKRAIKIIEEFSSHKGVMEALLAVETSGVKKRVASSLAD